MVSMKGEEEMCSYGQYFANLPVIINSIITFVYIYLLQITVTENGIVGVHGWLPFDKSISNYYTFEKDPSMLNSK